MRVLIADDDPVSLRLLASALGKAQHDVVVARDGREAWAKFKEADFPLVITDWLMPHVSGIELCERIRAEASDRYSYVVLVTTLSDEENSIAGFRAGADDYLVKPVRLAELERRVLVAGRVREGMKGKVEMTLRRAVEECQSVEEPSSRALLQTVQSLGDFYRTERAYTKARAFLRRQLALVGSSSNHVEEVIRLRRDLVELEGFDDERA